jgi:hypothetical protein
MPTTSVPNSSGAMMVLMSDLRAQQHGDEDPSRQRAAHASVNDQRQEDNPAKSRE